MKTILRVLAGFMFVFSLLVGIFGLYMAAQELSSLYFRTAAYHIGTGHYQQFSALLGVVGFLAKRLFTSPFVVGVALLITSFFLWRWARRLWQKTHVSNVAAIDGEVPFIR